MDQKNILPRGIAKPIEQQPDGTWIVRHHFRVVGTSENGDTISDEIEKVDLSVYMFTD